MATLISLLLLMPQMWAGELSVEIPPQGDFGVLRNKDTTFLELKTVLLSLKSLCGAFSEKYVHVQSDNTTTVAYLNAIGGIKSTPCNEMATMI